MRSVTCWAWSMESDEEAEPMSCDGACGGALAGSVTVPRTGKETTAAPQYEHSRLSEGISREQDEQVTMGEHSIRSPGAGRVWAYVFAFDLFMLLCFVRLVPQRRVSVGAASMSP